MILLKKEKEINMLLANVGKKKLIIENLQKI